MRTVFRNSEIPGRIHALQPFLSVGKLPDGTRIRSAHSGPAVTFGHLPPRLHASARSAVYVVYSYETPIAWVTENEDPLAAESYLYHIPNVGYSPTTGQHQYDVREAWREMRRGQGRGPYALDGRREVVRVPGNAEVYGVERRLRSGGLDGFQPGDEVRGHERQSAYEGVTEDAAHMGAVGALHRHYPAHP